MRTRTGLDVWSAPETRQGGNYSESIDYWGIGVIGYFIIMLNPPFYDPNEVKLLEKVQKCKYPKFTKKVKELYTFCLIDVITKLIVANPEQRPSPTDILIIGRGIHANNSVKGTYDGCALV
jgi:serine/threonine protein kinase